MTFPAVSLSNEPDRAAVWRNITARAREIAELVAAPEAATTDHEQSFPVAALQKLRQHGILRAPLNPLYGGCDFGLAAASMGELLLTLKHLGYGNLVVGRVFEGHFNALQLLLTYGRPAQIAQFSQDAQAGKLFGVWNTEAAAGLQLRRAADGGAHLSGVKTFATGVGYVERPVVNGAWTEGETGWQMCVVPFDEAATQIDESWWQPLGMRASRSFRIDFGGVRLAPAALLGAPGDYYRQPWFSGGAIRFAAVQLGGAEALFDTTRNFLRDLQRTGDPFQQARLGEMAWLCESGNLWLTGAANAWAAYAGTAPPDVDKLLAYAGMMRTAIEEICRRVMELCEKCIGARGLLRPLPFERIIRDLTIYLQQPAPDATRTGIGRYVLDANPVNADALWTEKHLS